MMIIFVTLCALLITTALADSNSGIASARIESCSGCSLGRLPEVKAFIMEDAPQYERVEVRFISGAPPELILLGPADKDIQRLPLSELNRKQCNQLLKDKGFYMKTKSDL